MQDHDTTERWLPIAGRPEYIISDQGRIAKVLKPSPSPLGYLGIRLGTRVDHEYIRIHSTVLQTFVEPRPEGMHCAHLDGDNQNNRLKNLRWVTPKENISHKKDHGRHKLSWDDVREIRRLRAMGERVRVIARRYGVSEPYVSNICANRSWVV